MSLKVFLAAVAITVSGTSAFAEIVRDVQFDSIPGVDPNLLSLDIYSPEGADGTNPVMFLVHGGSFTAGDKATFGWVNPKTQYYNDRGWVVVSTNYRLTDLSLPADDPNQVSHPDHIQDVARSIAWTKENIGNYGGNTDTLVLMGFSAGSQLVALAGTDETRLEAEGMSLSDIDAVIALDGLYDIPLRYRQPPPFPNPANVLIWGDDLATQNDMSPAFHVEPGKDIPPMLVIHQDLPNQTEQSNNFVDLLNANDYHGVVHNAVGLGHTQIGQSVGVAGHELTSLVDNFIHTATVPEPSSGVLVTMSMVVSLLQRRGGGHRRRLRSANSAV